MRIAILSDVHANREAFDVVLEAARERGTDQLVLLGDLVGYGPDPVYVVEKAAD
ncbi:MAG: metallophosphoesterase, partial [Mesorhizobium sp.]